MLPTLYSKLAAVLLGLFVLVGGMAAYGTYRFIDLYHEESRQRLNLTLARHIAEQSRIGGTGAADLAPLRALFDMQMMVNPSIEIYLLGQDGKILSYSAPKEAVKLERVALAPIARFLADPPELPILGDDPREPGARRIFSATPIPRHGKLDGYLYVMLVGEDDRTMASLLRTSHVFKLAAGIGALVLVVAIIAGLVLFASMTRRLERLAHAMDEFKRSDFASRPFVAAGTKGGDEIDRLAANFRDLAGRIAGQLSDLKQTDVLRRELVANVSHDLKTPLATLQGYIDTLLLKDGRLSEQERLSYLQIASRSGERLSKLVANLIELAKLDAKEVALHVEPFSAAELVQDVAQKFQLKAQERKIGLETDLPERAPYVCADIGLIERVLENLIGNAIAHTNPGGVVRAGLEVHENAVTIRVADTGVGIPEEEIPNVFERFYRVDQGGRGSGENAGLGLAIAKSILDLHGAAMHVDSKVGVGTTFSFSLRKAVLAPARLDVPNSTLGAYD
ncbi:MAG: ATP-binding protein [Burkholderiales bacterium]